MKKILFWGTLAAGVTAAYMMSKRGASFGEIASKTLRNPLGTLIDEVKGSVTGQPKQISA